MLESSTCEELLEKDEYLSSIYFPQWRLESLKTFLLEKQKAVGPEVTYQYELDSDPLKIEVINKTQNTNVSLLTKTNFEFKWNQDFLKSFITWSSSQKKR